MGYISFLGVYLRVDGGGVDESIAAGAGVVNCLFEASTNEMFTVQELKAGVYTIESARFPNTLLCMDTSEVNKFIAASEGP